MYKIFYFIIISSMNDFQINSNSNPYKKRRLYYNIDNPNPNPKPKPNPNPNIFILNMNNLDNYKSIDPDELIIVYSSNEYSNILYQTICEGGTKFNVKKLITSDSVINEYIKYLEAFKERDAKAITAIHGDTEPEFLLRYNKQLEEICEKTLNYTSPTNLYGVEYASGYLQSILDQKNLPYIITLSIV